MAGRSKESLVRTMERMETEGPYPDSAYALLNFVGQPSVALVDVLFALGLRPDGIVGHSLGEIAAAYADGSLTAAQAVLCAYWRGRCLDLTDLPRGAMAAVGLSWEEATQRCCDGVIPACHNAEGLGDSVWTTTSGPVLLQALKKVIPEPKPRSERWVCSSFPQSRWHEPIAQWSSAEYHVNNLLSPVLFCDALKHVPEDAVAIEIAPHCLLQAILRRALGSDATSLGLMKRNVDNHEFFLNSLGKLHVLGVKMDLSPLYPPVPLPVPRGTPSIAHLVSWDHSQSWNVAKWEDFGPSSKLSQEIVELDFDDNGPDAYLTCHQVQGRIVFPAAGYIVLAWKSLAKRLGKPFYTVPVVLEDLNFNQASLLQKD
ncbi:hypothetical protein MTO96_037061, partial [Rhipicephalus appendiculatus]